MTQNVRFDLVEVSNEKAWKKAQKLILENVEAICRGLVTQTYIRTHALKTATLLLFGYVMVDQPERPKRGVSVSVVNKVVKVEKLAGFVIANSTDYPGFLYIDVICSHMKIGNLLLQHVEEYARNTLRLSGLILASLPHVIGYYRKMGFTNQLSCDIPEDAKINHIYNIKIKPLIEQYKGDFEKYIGDEVYLKFLELLMRSNLAKNKSCKKIEDCNIDGYLMMKCFAPIMTKKKVKHRLPPVEIIKPSSSLVKSVQRNSKKRSREEPLPRRTTTTKQSPSSREKTSPTPTRVKRSTKAPSKTTPSPRSPPLSPSTKKGQRGRTTRKRTTQKRYTKSEWFF